MLKSWIFFFLILVVIVIAITIVLVFLKRAAKINNEMPPTVLNKKGNGNARSNRIIFNTDDGVEIVADYYSVSGAKFAGILLHMMPSDRKSYSKIAEVFNQVGWNALAIDLRGHGESVNSTKGKLDFSKFTDKEHQGSIFDISAASNFLKSQGFAVENQFLVGASIGANLSMQFLSENKNIKASILLSPGLDYRGILTEPLLAEEISDKILFISTTGDSYSYNTVQELRKKSSKTEQIIFTGNEHGTDILKSHKEAIEKITNWLKGKLI